MTEWLNGRFVWSHSLDALRRSADSYRYERLMTEQLISMMVYDLEEDSVIILQ